MVSGLVLIGNIEKLPPPHWFPLSGFSVHDDLGEEKINSLSLFLVNQKEREK